MLAANGSPAPEPPVIDYSQNYLTIESLDDNNTIGWKTNSSKGAKTILVSTDNGATWTSKTPSTAGTTLAILNTGDKLLIKGSNAAYGTQSYYNYFVSSARFNVSGNIMSLIYGDNFRGQTTLSTGWNFKYLFWQCTRLISAENLILPATKLIMYCYSYMFMGCSALTSAPTLPATTLATYCYCSMFEHCLSLTTAPELPATTLATYCYYNMFSMCTSLTIAPTLPAIKLVGNCYKAMFSGCSSLNHIKCLATDISATNCTYNWVYSVAASGTFTKNASMSSWTRNADGIPIGWTVVDEQGS